MYATLALLLLLLLPPPAGADQSGEVCRLTGGIEGLKGCAASGPDLVYFADAPHGLVVLNRTAQTLQQIAELSKQDAYAVAPMGGGVVVVAENAGEGCLSKVSVQDGAVLARTCGVRAFDLAVLDQYTVLATDMGAVWKYNVLNDELTLFAGSASEWGIKDGGLQDARFNFLAGICVDGANNRVFVLDSEDDTVEYIRQIDLSNGQVSTLLKTNSSSETLNGPRVIRMYNSKLLITDAWNLAIKEFDPSSNVLTLLVSRPVAVQNAIPWGLTTYAASSEFIFGYHSEENDISMLYVYLPKCADQDATWLPPLVSSLQPAPACLQDPQELLSLAHYTFTQGTAAFLDTSGTRLESQLLPPSHESTSVFVQLLGAGEAWHAPAEEHVGAQPNVTGWKQETEVAVFVKTPVVYLDTCRVQLEYVGVNLPVAVESLSLETPERALAVPCVAESEQRGVCTVQGDACRAFGVWDQNRTASVRGQQVLFAARPALPAFQGVFVQGPQSPVIPGVDAWANFSVYASVPGTVRSFSFTFNATGPAAVLGAGFYAVLDGPHNVTGWRMADQQQQGVVHLCTLQVQVRPEVTWDEHHPSVLEILEVLSIVTDDNEVLSRSVQQGVLVAGFRTSPRPKQLGVFARAQARNYVLTKPDGSMVGAQGGIVAGYIKDVFGQPLQELAGGEPLQCSSADINVSDDCASVMPNPAWTKSPAHVSVQLGGTAAVNTVPFAVFGVRSMRLVLKDATKYASDPAASYIQESDCLRLQVLVQWRGHPSGNASGETDITKNMLYKVPVTSSNNSRVHVVDQAWACAVGLTRDTATLSVQGTAVSLLVKIEGQVRPETQRTLQHAGVAWSPGLLLNPHLKAVNMVGMVGDVHWIVPGVSQDTRRMVALLNNSQLALNNSQLALTNSHVGETCLSSGLYVGMNYTALRASTSGLRVTLDTDVLYSVLPGGEDQARAELGVVPPAKVLGYSGLMLQVHTGHARGINDAVVQTARKEVVQTCTDGSSAQMTARVQVYGLQLDVSYACVQTEGLTLHPVLLANRSMPTTRIRSVCNSSEVFESLVVQVVVNMSTGEQVLVQNTSGFAFQASPPSVLSVHDNIITGEAAGDASVWLTSIPRRSVPQGLSTAIDITVEPPPSFSSIADLEYQAGEVRVVFAEGRGALTTGAWAASAAGYTLEQIFGSVVSLASTDPGVVQVLPDGTLQTVGNGYDATGTKLRLAGRGSCSGVAVREVLSPLQGNLEPTERGSLDLGLAAGPVPIPPAKSTQFDVRVAGSHLQAFDITVQYDHLKVSWDGCHQKAVHMLFFWCTHSRAMHQVRIVGWGGPPSAALPNSTVVVASLVFHSATTEDSLTTFHATCTGLVFHANMTLQVGCASVSVPFYAKGQPLLQQQQQPAARRRRSDMWHSSWRKNGAGNRRRLLQQQQVVAWGDVDGDDAFTLLDLVAAYEYHRAHHRAQDPPASGKRWLHAVADPRATSGMRDLLYLGNVYAGLLPFVAAVNMTSERDLVSLEVQLHYPEEQLYFLGPSERASVAFETNSTQQSLLPRNIGISQKQGMPQEQYWTYRVSQGQEASSMDDLLQRIVLRSERSVGVAFVLTGPSGYRFPFFSTAEGAFRPYRTLDITATNVCNDTYARLVAAARNVSLPADAPTNVTEVDVPLTQAETYTVLLKFDAGNTATSSNMKFLGPVACVLLAHAPGYDVHSLTYDEVQQEGGLVVVGIPLPADDAAAASAQAVAHVADQVLRTGDLAYTSAEIIWRRHSVPAPPPPPDYSGSSREMGGVLLQLVAVASLLWIFLDGGH